MGKTLLHLYLQHLLAFLKADCKSCFTVPVGHVFRCFGCMLEKTPVEKMQWDLHLAARLQAHWASTKRATEWTEFAFCRDTLTQTWIICKKIISLVIYGHLYPNRNIQRSWLSTRANVELTVVAQASLFAAWLIAESCLSGSSAFSGGNSSADKKILW